MSGTMAFVIGAAGLSALFYWLMTRTENISARRSRSSNDRTSNDYSYGSSGGSNGWNIGNWFSSDNSKSNCSSDNSSSSDSSTSSSDSCSSGGGDSGGGGGDGGGGGGD